MPHDSSEKGGEGGEKGGVEGMYRQPVATSPTPSSDDPRATSTPRHQYHPETRDGGRRRRTWKGPSELRGRELPRDSRTPGIDEVNEVRVVHVSRTGFGVERVCRGRRKRLSSKERMDTNDDAR